MKRIYDFCFAHTRQRVPFYVQVLRNFWRIFAWHVTTFAGIFLLYAVLDEGLLELLLCSILLHSFRLNSLGRPGLG